jgi:UTP--glucose-1-phosphate uridylyltransferase
LSILRKVVIPAAGLGSRLLPVTKEMPKEMLPVFCRCRNSRDICLKPILQVIFETLTDAGGREFCIIVGRGKRSVEDYFTLDEEFVSQLARDGKNAMASELSEFYRRIKQTMVVFINQPEPRGFGDAVLRAENFVGKEPFILHAGDDLIASNLHSVSHISRLNKAFFSLEADAAFFVETTRSPERYGVIRCRLIQRDLYKVLEVVEKPKRPPSKLGVIAIYALSPAVFRYLHRVKPDRKGELQLADAVQGMIEDDRRVFALGLQRGEHRFDVGTPETYLKALGATL